MNTEHDWLVWWHDEGSGMRPINGQDHESHVRDMTRIAWLNGAFGAADEIERLRAERDEARREVCSLQPFAHHNDGIAKDHAAYRKWDCFKENTDAR
jgi:hypothetical protein